jgi:multiple sugar transport system substrate-binding protein
MFSHGGSVYKDPQNGDFTIVFNSENNRKALEKYIEVRDKVGHPNAHSIGQGEMIQYLRTGKAAHAIAVIAAWGGMDDKKSRRSLAKWVQHSSQVDQMEVQVVWATGKLTYLRT